MNHPSVDEWIEFGGTITGELQTANGVPCARTAVGEFDGLLLSFITINERDHCFVSVGCLSDSTGCFVRFALLFNTLSDARRVPRFLLL